MAKDEAGSLSTERDPLTADKVLDAALDIIEREGVEAFTIRGLAAALGVRTPTIYWHVGGRDEVFNQLIERINDELGAIEPQGETPRERVASVAHSLLAEVRARPELVALSGTQGRGEAIFTKAQEVLALELANAGLTGEEAVFAFSAILFHLGGFIMLENALSQDYRIHGAARWAGRAEYEATSAYVNREVDLDAIHRVTLDAVLRDLLPDPQSTD